MQPLVDSGWMVGAAVALVTGGEVLYMGYGRVAADDPRRPSPDTVFEIGSVTEVFTALVLADMAARGELALDTPLQALLPEGATAPVRDGRPVTLAHLASHASGLPRLPPELAPADPTNPYADYGEAELLASLSRVELRSVPGETYLYSNFAAGLLGHVLAHFAGAELGELVTARIAGPLGLRSTSIELSRAQLRRLALGHDGDGRMVSAWDFGALAGAGALRSTARDLAALVRAHLALEPRALAPAIRLAERARVSASAGGRSVGLGWHIDPDGVRWHNGETGGYRSYIAYHRASGLGVVLLCNTSTWIGDAVGEALMAGLRGRWDRLEIPAVAAVAPAALARYAGRYRSAAGEIVISFETGAGAGSGEAGGSGRPGVLVGRIAGQPEARLYPTSRTEFALRVVPGAIVFLVEQDRVTGLILRAAGRELRARRIAGD